MGLNNRMAILIAGAAISMSPFLGGCGMSVQDTSFDEADAKAQFGKYLDDNPVMTQMLCSGIAQGRFDTPEFVASMNRSYVEMQQIARQNGLTVTFTGDEYLQLSRELVTARC